MSLTIKDGNNASQTLKTSTVDGDQITHHIVEDGVPHEYSKQTASGGTFLVQKGQLNSFRLRPQILNEHAESSRVAQTIVTASNIAGQIFKASQNNINGFSFSAESAGGSILDDFESYADNAALQAVWVATGELADVETTTVFEGAQSMYLPAGAGSTGDEWANTFASIDLTGFTGQFQINSNKEYKDVQMRLFVEDSLGNTNSRQIVQSNKDVWTKIVAPIDSLTADDVTPADLTDIVKIGYRVEKERNDGFMIVDILISVPGPGSVQLKLWDMGATLPTSGVTALADGTQYTTLGDLGISGNQVGEINVELLGGKRFYHVNEFVAGTAKEIPANVELTVGNYYAVTIHHVDTETTIYGPDQSFGHDYYASGFGFTAPDSATAITALGANQDLSFLVYSSQDAYVTEVSIFLDAAPNGASQTTLYVEDIDMARTDVLIAPVKSVQVATQSLTIPFYMEQGGKFEDEYNDDITDPVKVANLIMQYRFIPPTVNG
jgi:hypothetical protein